VSLTAAGATLLERARDILAAANDAVEMARRAEAGEVGRLSVAFTPVAAYDLLPPAVRAFLRRFPAVHLRLRELWSADQVTALREQSVDLGIVHLPIDERGLVVRRLQKDRVVVALPARHRAARASRVDPADLADEAWLRFWQPGESQDRVLDAMMRETGIQPRIVQQATQIPTLLGMVAAGIGIGLVPPAVQRIRFRGVAYRPLVRGPDITTAAVWRADDTSTALSSFVDALSGSGS